MFLNAFSQNTQPASTYTSKPLTADEVNFVSSYYTQNGDHSAVTGGIGSEKVTDIANGLEVKFVGWDANSRKHTITAGVGFDYHTAASQAYVSKTGASKKDGVRLYPSLNWTMENVTKGTSFGFGVNYSGEYNYQSFGLDAEYTKKTHNNGEFNAKLTTYFDQVKQIYPSELKPATTTVSSASSKKDNTPSDPRNTYTASFSFAQVINQRLQGSVMLDLVAQNGDLGLPFHRVYFTDGSDHVELLPSTRHKLPIGFRLNYFLGDLIILKSYYRYYIDDWGLKSNTFNLEMPIKITPFFSVSPFYRYYTQTAVDYFAAYEKHTSADQYYTSNYSLSAFNSSFFGAGLRISPPKGIFNSKLNTLEIRYGHYTQTTDLVSDVISVNLKFK